MTDVYLCTHPNFYGEVTEKKKTQGGTTAAGGGGGTRILVLYTCVTKTYTKRDFPSPGKTPPEREFRTIFPQIYP